MEQQKKIDPVAKGQVGEKPNALKKAVRGFISTDSAHLGDYLINDIIMPSIKDMISKAVKGGIDTILYGPGKSGQNSKNSSFGSRISYSSLYSNERATTPARSHAVYEYRDVYYSDDATRSARVKAEEVLSTLYDILSQYGSVNVAQFFEASEITPEPNDYNYGWYDLTGSRSYRCLDGKYRLELPPAVVLKK